MYNEVEFYYKSSCWPHHNLFDSDQTILSKEKSLVSEKLRPSDLFSNKPYACLANEQEAGLFLDILDEVKSGICAKMLQGAKCIWHP